MATYSHIYPYIQHIYTMCTMTSQCIYSQEADVLHQANKAMV